MSLKLANSIPPKFRQNSVKIPSRFRRHCEGATRPKQSRSKQKNLNNEIASSFASLAPRNDGILDGISL